MYIKQDPTVNELEKLWRIYLGWLPYFSFWNNGKSNGDKATYTTRTNNFTINIRIYIIMKVVGASFNSGVSCCLVDGNRG